MYASPHCTQTQVKLPYDNGEVKTEIIIGATISPLAVVSMLTILLIASLCYFKMRKKNSATAEEVRSKTSDHIYEEVQLPVPVEAKLKANKAYKLVKPYSYIFD